MADPTRPDPDPPGEPDDALDPMDKPVGAGIDFTDPNSPLAPFYFRLTDVLAMLVLGLFAVLFGNGPLAHTDVWAHLKLGGNTVRSGWPADRETVSPYTAPNASGVRFAWLTQVLYDRAFATGQRLAGGEKPRQFAGAGELLRTAHTVAAVAAAVAFWLACRRATGSSLLALLGLTAYGVLLSVVVIGVHRPQLFGALGFAVLLAVVSRAELRRWHLAAVPLMFVLWANLHGSFAVGFALLGLVVVGRGYEVWRAAAGRRWGAVWVDRRLRLLAGSMLIALAAVAVLNPDGPRLYAQTAGFGSNPNLKSLREWFPLDVTSPDAGSRVYWLSLGLLVVVFALSPAAPTPFQLLSCLLFGLAPLYQVRLLSWWLPLAVWIALPHLAMTGRAWGVKLPQTVPSFKRTVLAAVLFALCTPFIPAVRWVLGGPPPAITAVYHPATPLELVAVVADPSVPTTPRMAPVAEFLQERYAGRPVGPVLTSPELGELLYWRDVPGSPPLLFTHAHLFPPAHWANTRAAAAGQPGWWEFLDRQRVNLIAVEPDSHARLVDAVTARPDDWQVLLNERGSEKIRLERARLFVAARKVPK